jgi:hypothetical protein
MHPVTDVLATTVAELTTFASERGVPLVPGFFDQRKLAIPTVDYRADLPQEAEDDVLAQWRAFRETVSTLDVAMLILYVTRLDQAEWEEAVAQYQSALDEARELGDGHDGDEEPEGADLETLRRLLAEAEAVRPHIGHVSFLDVHAVLRNPTAVITCSTWAPWSEVISDVDERLADAAGGEDDELDDDDGATREAREAARMRREEYEARERERRFWTPKKRTETARRLAEAEGFDQAKREADRVYLLRKLLGDEAPAEDHLLKEMAREALAIYRLEVKPKR